LGRRRNARCRDMCIRRWRQATGVAPSASGGRLRHNTTFWAWRNIRWGICASMYIACIQMVALYQGAWYFNALSTLSGWWRNRRRSVRHAYYHINGRLRGAAGMVIDTSSAIPPHCCRNPSDNSSLASIHAPHGCNMSRAGGICTDARRVWYVPPTGRGRGGSMARGHAAPGRVPRVWRGGSCAVADAHPCSSSTGNARDWRC